MTKILKSSLFLASLSALAFAPVAGVAASAGSRTVMTLGAGPSFNGAHIELARQGRGKDDGAGHNEGGDRGGKGRGRGKDDGPGHNAGDDRGGKGKGGKGRGRDDGANHT